MIQFCKFLNEINSFSDFIEVFNMSLSGKPLKK